MWTKAGNYPKFAEVFRCLYAQRLEVPTKFLYTTSIQDCARSLLTLLQVRILTGRSHQIRVHMQNIGVPLCADFKYAEREVRAAPLPTTL